MSVSYTEKIEIGIIGQGSLARLIAARLAKAEFSLNILENQLNKQISSSVRCYKSPAALSRACSIIITVLSDGPELEQVLFGNEGIAQCTNTNCIVIDMSSVSPEFIAELSEQLVEKDISFLDAVLINENNEDSDTLQMILVGGEGSVYERVLPVFEKISKKVKHIGVNGASQFYRQAFAVRKKIT